MARAFVNNLGKMLTGDGTFQWPLKSFPTPFNGVLEEPRTMNVQRAKRHASARSAAVRGQACTCGTRPPRRWPASSTGVCS